MVADGETDTHTTHIIHIYTFLLNFEVPPYLCYFYSVLSTHKSFLLVYNNRVMFCIYLLLLSSLYILMSRWRLEQQQAFAETARPYYFFPLDTQYTTITIHIIHDNRHQLIPRLYLSTIIYYFIVVRRRLRSEASARPSFRQIDFFFSRAASTLPVFIIIHHFMHTIDRVHTLNRF